VPPHFKSRHIARHSNIPFLGRTRLMAHLQGALAAAHSSGAGRFPLLAVFMQSPFPWLAKYLKGILHGRYKPYPVYPLDGHSGVYPLQAHAPNQPIRLSLAGDWGTGTEEAYKVAQQISAFRPDYTLHLGDVSYVGDDPEVGENFLGIPQPDSPNTPVAFPRGAVGTLTLPGNHELYGGGKPYYTRVLPWGSPAPGQPQQAAFFSLESDHWRILGLDTGYNSTGVPILGSLPGLAGVQWIGGNGRIEPSVLDWLRTNVQPLQRPKTTLLLTHHQYYSAFADEVFPRPAEQLAEFFPNQDILWLWGHEHRLAVYDLHSPDGKIRCYGRCIGHGGMPVETAGPHPGDRHHRAPLLYRDPRTNYSIGDGDTAGWNGFINLTLNGPTLHLDYRDLTGQSLFTETFTATPNATLARSP
jgi:hypothetical protein